MITSKKSLVIIQLIADLFILDALFFASAILAQSYSTLMARSYMFALLILLDVVWYYSAVTSKYYEDILSKTYADQFAALLKAIILQAITSVLFIFITKEDLFTRNFILYNLVSLFFFISIRTIFFRKYFKHLRKKGKFLRNLLIIGGGDIGKNFYDTLKQKIEVGYNLVGFVSDNDSDNRLGNILNLSEIIAKHAVQEAVIALPNSDDTTIDEVIHVCNKAGIRVHIIPDYFRFLSKRFQFGTIDKFPILTIRREPLEEIYWNFIKRSFDIVISLLTILFVFSWLMPIIFILQKIYNPGKIFFVQDRIGLNNKYFRCYKLRTMVEQKRPREFKPTLKGDPRVTRFGSFLRKTNIDELPQFFNVLLGSMSLVGPRPHAIAYNESYKDYSETIMLRHLVKPGITGWAQVHGYRGDVEDETEQRIRTQKRIEFDLWYIENWSITLDIQIILTTIWQIVNGVNKGH